MRDIYMCFPFVRDPFGPLGAREVNLSSSSVIDEAFSSASRRLYPVRDERTFSPLFATVTLPQLTGSKAGLSLLPPLSAFLFCKVLFFRNADPTIVFPYVALSPTRFLQSGRVIQGLLHGRLSLPPIFRTLSTSRQIGKCAPSRIH